MRKFVAIDLLTFFLLIGGGGVITPITSSMDPHLPTVFLRTQKKKSEKGIFQNGNFFIDYLIKPTLQQNLILLYIIINDNQTFFDLWFLEKNIKKP
jgi:hypothetical protein